MIVNFEDEYQKRVEDEAFRELEKRLYKGDCEKAVDLVRKQVGGSHYQLAIEPIDFIVKNELGYREGNVIKYITRHTQKNGAEDIKKAIHYLEMILEDYND
jgi:hypothetical protein